MSILQEALDSWIETWHNNKTLFWMEFTGTLLGMVSSVVLNVLANNPPMLFILLCYLVSGLLLAIASNIRRSPFIFLLMSFYTLAAVYGLIVLHL